MGKAGWVGGGDSWPCHVTNVGSGFRVGRN